MVGINKEHRASSTADVPSNSGLGSSSCFTVALLNALHAYKESILAREGLAEEACHVEIDLLGEADRQAGPVYGRLRRYYLAFTFDKMGMFW